MNPNTTSLHYKTVEPRKKTPGPPPALILLHGRGADEKDLLGLVEYFDERLFVVSARAPFQFQSGGGYTWYDLEEIGRPEAAMFKESYDRLCGMFSEVRAKFALNPSKTFFCGFSMGTVMSYAMALSKPDEVSGVLANSGYLPESVEVPFHWDKIRGKPFFIGHGKYDPVIPLVFGERAKDLLEKAEAKVSYHEYDMAHQITEESLHDMMQWLTVHI